MSLHLTHEVLQLGLRDPFRIARTDHAASAATVTTVVVELRDDRVPEFVGVGEGYPDRFYGETPATMATVFPSPRSTRVTCHRSPAGRAQWNESCR